MLKLLNTRPEGKGQPLTEQLEQVGCGSVLFPLISIEAIALDPELLASLVECELIIIVSQDAALKLAELTPQLHQSVQFIAVGERTAEVIAEHFNKTAIVPIQQDSDGVVELDQLQEVEGKSIALIKGEAGRPLIADTLLNRKAKLHVLSMYRRIANEFDHLTCLKTWQQQGINALLLTSNSSVDALFQDTPDTFRSWLDKQQFVVVSDRIGQYVESLGINSQQIHITNGASNAAIVAAVKELKDNMTDQELNTDNSLTSTESADQHTLSKQGMPQETSSLATSAKKGNPPHTSSSISKVGVVALLLSLVAVGGTAYLYWTQQKQVQQDSVRYQQQLLKLEQTLAEQTEQNKQLLSELARQLEDQQADWANVQANKSQQNLEKIQALSDKAQLLIQQLDAEQIQLNPQEVYSLMRMVVFKVEAEKSYKAAAAMLKRLDDLLAEQGGYTRLRQAIHSDIQLLNGLDKNRSEQLYLTLHGLIQQIPELKFQTEMAFSKQGEQPLALTENIEDYQQNIKQSLHQFIELFFRVREHSQPVQPLLSSQQSQAVSARLALHLSQAQQALSFNYTQQFRAALDAALAMLVNYYDMENSAVNAFISQLEQLKADPLLNSTEVRLASPEVLKEQGL